MRKLKVKRTFEIINPTTEYYEFIDRINEEFKNRFSSINSREEYCPNLETNDIITNLFHSVDTIFRTFSNDDFRLIVHPHNKGIYIHILEVSSHLQGKGIGSKIMRMVSNISNEMDTPIYLVPVKMGSVPIDVLRKFYHRFGYKRESNSRYWKYSPVKVISLEQNIEEYRMVG